MRALTLIYSQRVPRIQETPIGFNPKIGKESKSVQERQNVYVGRPTPILGRPLGRPGPTESSRSTVPVDRSFATLDRAVPVHGMHTGRLGLSPGLLRAPFSFLLVFNLCSIFLMSLITLPISFYLLYLFSPCTSLVTKQIAPKLKS